jgi:hypothetical protein
MTEENLTVLLGAMFGESVTSLDDLYISAVAGDDENPSGTNGRFMFTARNDDDNFDILSAAVTILATPYSGGGGGSSWYDWDDPTSNADTDPEPAPEPEPEVEIEDEQVALGAYEPEPEAAEELVIEDEAAPLADFTAPETADASVVGMYVLALAAAAGIIIIMVKEKAHKA